MIDAFSLGLTHALMVVALWRLLRRPDLDHDDGGAARPRWGTKRGGGGDA